MPFVPEDQVPTTEDQTSTVQQTKPGGFVPEGSVQEGAAGGSKPLESTDILPFTKYPSGWALDPNAGLLGAARSAFNLPGDVLTGQTTMADPATQQRAIEASTFISPDAAPAASSKIGPPDFRAIYDASDAGYARAASMPVNYRIAAIQNMTTRMQQQLYSMGIGPTDAPQTYAKLGDMLKTPYGAVSIPLNGLESFRKGFSRLGRSKNDTERLAASTVTSGIDDFYANPSPQTVHSGPAEEAAPILAEARANYAAAARSENLNKLQRSAQLKAEDPNAPDYGVLLQRRLRWLSDPDYPARLRGFNQDEQSAILAASQPGAAQKVIGSAEKLLGERGWLAYMGEKAGGIPGMIIGGVVPPVASNMFGRVNEYLANKGFNRVDELVRSRSPLAKQQPEPTWFDRSSPDPSRAPSAIRVGRVLGPQALRQVDQLKPVQVDRPMVPATRGVNTPQPELYD